MFACIYSQSVAAGVSLSDFAYSFSPLVEETNANTAVIDVEGCSLRFGSPYELAVQIARQAKAPAGGLGCKVSVALAANPDAAIYAARNFPGITFIAAGEELNALGEIPIEKLIEKHKGQGPTFQGRGQKTNSNSKSQTPDSKSPDSAQHDTADVGHWTLDIRFISRFDEILETLHLWGVRTFREFAELPAAGVAERLGQAGLKLQELAAGKIDRHLKLRQPAQEFKGAVDLEYPIGELEPLSFIFSRLLNQICANLNAYALATNLLQVELKLTDGRLHKVNLNLPHPMRDHQVFLKLLLLDMEMHSPGSAICNVAINCEPVKPRSLQTGLFVPLAPEPEKLELLLARLAKLVGKENIGSPKVLDTHRPDAFTVNRFELKEKKKTRRRKINSPPPENSPPTIRSSKVFLGFRVFRPPLRAMVQVEKGCPKEISAWGKNKSVYGKVVGLAGPWRTSGDWWRADRWARDEWDVAVENSGQWGVGSGQKSKGAQVLYRIYRELKSGGWFVEGVYD